MIDPKKLHKGVVFRHKIQKVLLCLTLYAAVLRITWRDLVVYMVSILFNLVKCDDHILFCIKQELTHTLFISEVEVFGRATIVLTVFCF